MNKKKYQPTLSNSPFIGGDLVTLRLFIRPRAQPGKLLALASSYDQTVRNNNQINSILLDQKKVLSQDIRKWTFSDSEERINSFLQKIKSHSHKLSPKWWHGKGSRKEDDEASSYLPAATMIASFGSLSHPEPATSLFEIELEYRTTTIITGANSTMQREKETGKHGLEPHQSSKKRKENTSSLQQKSSSRWTSEWSANLTSLGCTERGAIGWARRHRQPLSHFSLLSPQLQRQQGGKNTEMQQLLGS